MHRLDLLTSRQVCNRTCQFCDAMISRPSYLTGTLVEGRGLTKVVALAMQMLDRKPGEEPVTIVEEGTIEYEA